MSIPTSFNTFAEPFTRLREEPVTRQRRLLQEAVGGVAVNRLREQPEAVPQEPRIFRNPQQDIINYATQQLAATRAAFAIARVA